MIHIRLIRMAMVIVASMICFSCAANKVAFNSKETDIKVISSLKIVRHKVQRVEKVTWGRILGGSLFGGIGMAATTASGGISMAEQYNLPDHGKLILDKFIEIAPIEIQGWPKMEVQDNTIEDGYTYNGYILEFIPVSMVIATMEGGNLSLNTTILMKDGNGKILLQDKFMYNSKNYGRSKPLEIFEAENGKLLKEEIQFGSDISAKRFISLFKGE